MKNEIIKTLKKLNIAPNKLMGQHFLIDDEVLQKIVTSATVQKRNVILEVGPGLGILTRALAKKARKIIAVEKDPALADALQKQLAEEKIVNVKIITQDILRFSPQTYGLQKGKYKIVANLPYYLTGKFLKKFLTEKENPTTMALLLQKEVAERIIARPPKMSLLSLSVQTYAKPEIILEVSKNSFYPKPRVDSALIKLSGISKEFFKKNKLDEQMFWKIAKAGFLHKRKTLLNNLSGAFAIPKPELKQILKKINVDPKSRAETLSPEKYAALVRCVVKISQ